MARCDSEQARLALVQHLRELVPGVSFVHLAPATTAEVAVPNMIEALAPGGAVVFADLGFTLGATRANGYLLNVNREAFAASKALQLWIVRTSFGTALSQTAYDLYSWFQPNLLVSIDVEVIVAEEHQPLRSAHPKAPPEVRHYLHNLLARFRQELQARPFDRQEDVPGKALLWTVLKTLGNTYAPDLLDDAVGAIAEWALVEPGEVATVLSDPASLDLLGYANSFHERIGESIAAFGRAIDIMEGLRALLEPRGEWSPALQNHLARAYVNLGVALYSAQDLRAAIEDYGRAITISEGLRTLLEPRGEWQPGLQNDLAAAYMNRGVALYSAQDLRAAIEDYGRAVDIMEGLRKLLEPRGEWQPGLQNDLARAYMNRGVALYSAQDLRAAIEDYGRAVDIMEGLRKLLEPRGEWQPGLQNDLARAYMNRGNALARAQDLGAAIEDYGRAITIREGLRKLLEPRGEWQPGLQNDLAAAYMNRGNALYSAQDLRAAIEDYGRAITIMEGLRKLLEPRGEWQPGLQNDLAAAYMNRGVALYSAQDLGAAIEDYGRAVDIMEGLRKLLEPRGEWQPGLQNDLARAYMNRGNALARAQDLGAAIEDYGRAITIREGLRARLEPRDEWQPALQNDLAAVYMNRGNALARAQDLRAAIEDYGRAITIREGLRTLLEPRGEWQPGLQNDLAAAYVNRGNALARAQDLGAAIEDYGRAITIMEGLRTLLEPRGEWQPGLQNDLAAAYMNRGNALARAQDLGAAIEDYGRAITIMEGLRTLLEPRGEWQPGLQNDLGGAYMNRGNALYSAQDLGAAIEDYGRAVNIMAGLAQDYPTLAIDLQRAIANWFLTRHALRADLARLADENNAQLRALFPADTLARNQVPDFNRSIADNLDAVPGLDPAEAERIRARLLAPV